MRPLFLSFFVSLLIVQNIDAEQKRSGLRALVNRFLEASTETEQREAIDAITSVDPEAEEIEKLLKTGRRYSRQVPLGWQVYENLCLDSVSRPYHVYVPETYEPDSKYWVLIDLHGGVSRSKIIPEKKFKKRRSRWEDEAKQEEFIYILPTGCAGAAWWNEIGAQHILTILREIKQRYNVDENRVFLTGFSDGGSGAYYMALNHCTPFAAFIPFNGHVHVAQMGGNPVYLVNLYNRPLYIVNTGRDGLYPTKEMMPYVAKMCETAGEMTFKTYRDFMHDFDYGDREKPLVLAFMKRTERNPFSSRVQWEASSLDFGRADWIRIQGIEDIGNNAEFEDANPIVTKTRVRLGIFPDGEFEGKGVRVDKVVEDYLAGKLGLEAEDVIIRLDDKNIDDLSDLQGVLRRKKPGDSLRVTVKRAKKKVSFEGRFDEAGPEPAFSRDSLSARLEAKALHNRIDVKVKNVAAYTVLVSREQFDLTKEIEVYTNGKLSFEGKVEPDPEFMLTQAARDTDRTMVFAAKIEIAVTQQQPHKDTESH